MVDQFSTRKLLLNDSLERFVIFCHILCQIFQYFNQVIRNPSQDPLISSQYYLESIIYATTQVRIK
jgi:hypothetical protein